MDKMTSWFPIKKSPTIGEYLADPSKYPNCTLEIHGAGGGKPSMSEILAKVDAQIGNEVRRLGSEGTGKCLCGGGESFLAVMEPATHSTTACRHSEKPQRCQPTHELVDIDGVDVNQIEKPPFKQLFPVEDSVDALMKDIDVSKITFEEEKPQGVEEALLEIKDPTVRDFARGIAEQAEKQGCETCAGKDRPMTEGEAEIAKRLNEHLEAHDTEEGYCCACEYDIAGFNERIEQAEKRGREAAVNEVTKRMKIADIIKPTDRSGLLVHIDEETLNETTSVWLIDGDALKAARQLPASKSKHEHKNIHISHGEVRLGKF